MSRKAQVIAGGIIAATFAMAGSLSPAEAQVPEPTKTVKEEDERNAVEYSWKDGATTVRFSRGEVRLSNRVQFRWTDQRDEGHGATRSLDIPRARTEAGGWMGSEHVTYEIQFDWADGPVLQDLFVSWDVSRRETFEIQLGQFKVPSGRQRLTSSGALQFVDRSIVADEFTEGQDIGLQVVGLVADQRMEYRVGVFNGAGQNTLSGRQGAQYNGRLMFQPFGPLDYSEGDLEFARGPLLAVAASLDMDDGRQRVGTERPGRTTIGADAAFRYRGLSLVGELFLRSGSREIGRTPRQVGFLVQGGYFVVPSRLEIAGRLATCDPAAPAPGDQEREVGLAAGYFLNGHNLKVQSDVRRLEDHRQKRADHELRVQLQIVF